PSFEAVKGRAEALYVCTDPLVTTNRIRINILAMSARLPTMHGLREYVEAGGLMSYGANFVDLYRRSGDYVDKILRWAKPGDIPVEQPTKFDLVINLTTARALGLEVPATLLARADEVIEWSAAKSNYPVATSYDQWRRLPRQPSSVLTREHALRSRGRKPRRNRFGTSRNWMGCCFWMRHHGRQSPSIVATSFTGSLRRCSNPVPFRTS